MAERANRQILLVAKPTDRLSPEHFRLTEGAAPAPRDGEVLLRVRYISLDAANRAWMHGATYRSAVEAGTVMAGGALAEVVESRAEGFAAGDLVFADTGWQDYAALPARALVKLPKITPLTHLLSVYGIAGSDRVFRPAARRAPQGGRDRRGLGGGRLGRLAGRPDRQDQGLPRGRNRGRRREVRLADRRTRVRRGGRLQGRQRVQGTQKRGAAGHRRLFRQCRRRYSGSVPGANERARPHRVLRRDLAIRRCAVRARAARRAGTDRGQAPRDAGVHRHGLFRRNGERRWPTSSHGSPPASSRCRRT